MKIEQYQIVIVNLNPTRGSEINKTRPCVIISPDELNRNISTLVIAPVTTTAKKYPTRIAIKQNTIDGFIAIDQIRTIDKSRIIKTVNKITKKEIEEVKRVIARTFVE